MRVSWSKVGYFKSCPRKYYLRYIEKLPQPKSLPLLSGSAFHEATAREYKQIMSDKISTTASVVEDCIDTFEKLTICELEHCGILDSKKLASEKDNLAAAQKLYHSTIMPHKRPVDVEHKFSVAFPDGSEITGYIDRIDEGREVVEMKTSARRCDLSLYKPQLCLYQAVKKERRGMIELVVKTKSPEVLTMPVQFTDDEFVNALANIKSVMSAIKALDNQPKEFYWQNSSFMCGMCWYKEECFGKKAEGQK